MFRQPFQPQKKKKILIQYNVRVSVRFYFGRNVFLWKLFSHPSPCPLAIRSAEYRSAFIIYGGNAARRRRRRVRDERERPSLNNFSSMTERADIFIPSGRRAVRFSKRLAKSIQLDGRECVCAV